MHIPNVSSAQEQVELNTQQQTIDSAMQLSQQQYSEQVNSQQQPMIINNNPDQQQQQGVYSIPPQYPLQQQQPYYYSPQTIQPPQQQQQHPSMMMNQNLPMNPMNGQQNGMNMLPLHPAFGTQPLPTSLSPYEGMIKDEKGRYSVIDSTSWFVTVGLLLFSIVLTPLLVGFVFLYLVIFGKSTDFTFDQEKRELIVYTHGSSFKMECLEDEKVIPYDSIQDITCEYDFKSKHNGTPNIAIWFVINDGQKIRFSTNFLQYHEAVSKRNNLVALIRMSYDQKV